MVFLFNLVVTGCESSARVAVLENFVYCFLILAVYIYNILELFDSSIALGLGFSGRGGVILTKRI